MNILADTHRKEGTRGAFSQQLKEKDDDDAMLITIIMQESFTISSNFLSRSNHVYKLMLLKNLLSIHDSMDLNVNMWVCACVGLKSLCDSVVFWHNNGLNKENDGRMINDRWLWYRIEMCGCECNE